jgi:hypothetical protein
VHKRAHGLDDPAQRRRLDTLEDVGLDPSRADSEHVGGRAVLSQPSLQLQREQRVGQLTTRVRRVPARPPQTHVMSLRRCAHASSLDGSLPHSPTARAAAAGRGARRTSWRGCLAREGRKRWTVYRGGEPASPPLPHGCAVRARWGAPAAFASPRTSPAHHSTLSRPTMDGDRWPPSHPEAV